ncbi:CHAD domain-containing protein [Methylocella sp.]|uniref:CYTH and CHAD domain-containing protein n=1 Tax=Methylocella sp. TaxID=1978226 RepID=UPI003783DD5B
MSETELKLVAIAGAAPALGSFAALAPACASARRTRLQSWHFDTPERALQKAGFVLRIRRAGDAMLQTVKTGGASAFERGEWEEPIAAPAPAPGVAASPDMLDFEAIARTPLGALIDGVRADLVEAFRVDVERETFVLETEDGEIEAACDNGEIVAERRGLRQGVAEIELELKRGDARLLFPLARELAAAAPLSLSLVSKAERGFRLARGIAGKAVKASPPRLAQEMTAADAFAAICEACLHDFMLNADALRARSDETPRGVHQGRIALRRLRAAFALFRPIVKGGAGDDLRAEVKRLASLFGRARDRDVMLEAALEAGDGDAGADGRAFADWLARESAALHGRIVEAIDSQRWRLFVIDFFRWLDHGGWRRRAAKRPLGMAEFARERLGKRRRRLLEDGRGGLGGLDAEQRHQVRIDAKTLRYMGEFFAATPAVADPQAMRKFLNGLEDIQTSLGLMHDEEARLEARASDLGRWRAEAGEVAPQAIAVAERFYAPREDVERRLGEAIAAFDKLSRADPFRLSPRREML